MTVVMSGANGLKTHCKRGHPLAGDNLAISWQNGTKRRRCVQCQKDWNVENAKWSTIKHRYGLTKEQWTLLLETQGNVCKICQRSSEKYCVDHDHTCCADRQKTCGKCVRGLLCNGCNVGIGAFGDSPKIMARAIEYLRGQT